MKMRSWRGLLMFSIITASLAQGNNGGRYEWGWQLHTPPAGGQPVTAGQYYIRLPEISGVGGEQRVHYQADQSGYHGAVAVSTTGDHHHHQQTFALGRPAINLLHNQLSQQFPHQHLYNSTERPIAQIPQPNGEGQPQVEIFLLQQQFTSPDGHNNLLHNTLANEAQHNPLYYTNNVVSTPAHYVLGHHQQSNVQIINENDGSKPLPEEVKPEHEKDEHKVLEDPVHVFKDHNCTDEDGKYYLPKSSVDYEQATTKLFAEIPSYNEKNYNEKFGAKLSSSYRVKDKDDRYNSRSERYYVLKPAFKIMPTKEKISEEGILKLVASTQDLISNEDLLTINHAVEKDGIHNDDLLKAKTRATQAESRTRNNYVPANDNKSKVPVDNTKRFHAKTQNSHTEDDNEYKFVTPIVVQDSTVNDYKSQVMKNLVSTIVPYLEEGYELQSVKNTLDEDGYIKLQENEKPVNVTPRPVSQKYLAAITVGLRLLNSNDTDINSVEDHEGSDSEVISDVQRPETEKTTVEVQKSIPLEITHINDVVVHEWDNKHNKNEPFLITKSLYEQYSEALESSRKIQQNMNKNLYLYGTMKDYQELEYENTNSSEDKHHANTVDEENANKEREQAEIQAQSTNHERHEYVTAYDNNFGEKLIQPIIIEKEVPVTKYVDRFIEKKVPYPEPVEVIKEVEVEKRVHVPYPVEKIVEKPVQVTKYVDRPQPYPVEVTRQVPVEVKVPYPVETKVFVDRPVHIPYPVEKIIEKQVVHQVAVPTPVAVPVQVQVPVERKVLYPVSVDKPYPVPYEVEKRVPYETIVEKQVPVPYPVEKRVPYPVPYETRVPVPYPVETRVPVPVDRIVEKPYTITKYIDRHIHIPVPQPVAVPVPQPYPVDRIVERKIPYPVPYEKIVEKKVQVPYPVEKVVEKIVEKPVVVTRYIDKPYPVEKRVPYPVEKIVERKVPYAVHVPIEVNVPYPVEKNVERPAQVPVRVPFNFERPDYFLPQASKNVANQPQHSQPQPHFIHPLAQQIPNYIPQYYRALQEKRNPAVQTTAWGNLYASTYQYINNTPEYHKVGFKKTPSLNKYIGYVTNSAPDQYYGPPPIEKNSYWNQNIPKNYMVEFKLRRTDRTPKVTNLRIEYGGFKPPLVPSTEVDLDGMPVKHEGQVLK